VLFLHGGPGDAWSPFADSMFGGWERDFTLVQWDQRGAGRTYGKNGPSIEPTMTIDRMVRDGIEVAEFLTKHLSKKKITIEGGSWGSILGIYMVHARPDLFYAYVGLAQMVNMRENQSVSYARVLELARAAGDQQAITELEKIGSMPWDSDQILKWHVYRKWELAYQAKRVTAPSPPDTISPEYASPEERAQYAAADDFSGAHFFGMTLSGPLEDVDLPSLGTEFAIPIYIIQGQEDLTALPNLAKAYFDSIKAPLKQFYLVPGTGHEPSAPQLELNLKVLTERVRPLALEH
jgi:pimeloyl-ACP methyl ester carboxylesterase